MIISELLGEHHRILKDLSTVFTEAPATILARAPDVSQARVSRLELRLKALADERSAEIARIDADIARTRDELKSLKMLASEDKQRVAPAQEAMAGKGKPATKVAAAKTVSSRSKSSAKPK